MSARRPEPADKRDERTWTLSAYLSPHGNAQFALIGPLPDPGESSLKVMPVAAHEAELARRSRVDHAEAERLHAELEQTKAEHEVALAALEALHAGFRERHLEVKGDGDWEQMVRTVLLLIDQQQPLFERCEELGQRLKTQAAALAAVADDEDSAGAECSRLESDILMIHDALVDAGHEGAINADSIVERIEALAAARQVDEAMVERATKAAWESLRARTRARTDHAIRPFDELEEDIQDAWRADLRAALLAARTPEPGEKRCARDSDWCDGVICRERGIVCPNAEPEEKR